MNRRFHAVLGAPIFADDPRAYAVSGNLLTDAQGRQIHDNNEANETGGSSGTKPQLPNTNVFESLVEWDEFYGPPVRKRKENRNVDDEWKRDADAIRAGRDINLGAPPQTFNNNPQQQQIGGGGQFKNAMAGAPYGQQQQQIAGNPYGNTPYPTTNNAPAPQVGQPVHQQQPQSQPQKQQPVAGGFASSPQPMPQQGPLPPNAAPRLPNSDMTAPKVPTSKPTMMGGLVGGLASQMGGSANNNQQSTVPQAQAYVPQNQQQQQQPPPVPHRNESVGADDLITTQQQGGGENQPVDLPAKIAEAREYMQRRIARMETRHRERMQKGSLVQEETSQTPTPTENEPPLAPSPLEDLALIFEAVLAQNGTPLTAQAQKEGIRQMPPDLMKTRIMSVYLQYVDLSTLPPHAQIYFKDLRAEIKAIGALPPQQQQEYLAAAPPPMNAAIMETRDIHRALEGGGSPSNICNQAMQRQILERLRINGGLVPPSNSHPNQPYPTPEGSRQHSASDVGASGVATSTTTPVNPMTPEGSPERQPAPQYQPHPAASNFSAASARGESGEYSSHANSPSHHPNVPPSH